MEQRMGGGGLFLVTTSDGTKKKLPAEEVQQMGVQIICNPFLLRLWPQHPDYMTLLPAKFACNFSREHSWRRMQIPSPPTTSLSMTIWCVHTPRSSLHFRSSPLTRSQVHKAEQRRLLTPAFDRRRALGGDARPLRRHARRSAQEPRVSLDAAARLRSLAAFCRCHCVAARRRRQGECGWVSWGVCQSE